MMTSLTGSSSGGNTTGPTDSFDVNAAYIRALNDEQVSFFNMCALRLLVGGWWWWWW
jgi:hypothetical protein